MPQNRVTVTSKIQESKKNHDSFYYFFIARETVIMQTSFEFFLPSLLHNDQALLKHSVVSLLQWVLGFFWHSKI